MSASSTHTLPRQVTVWRIVSSAWCAHRPGPKRIAGGQEVGFEDRLEHEPRRRHHHPVDDAGNAERPRLARPAWLGGMHPPQKPPPVGPGTQPRGELIEKLAHPGRRDVVDGDPIDARGATVSTDL